MVEEENRIVGVDKDKMREIVAEAEKLSKELRKLKEKGTNVEIKNKRKEIIDFFERQDKGVISDEKERNKLIKVVKELGEDEEIGDVVVAHAVPKFTLSELDTLLLRAISADVPLDFDKEDAGFYVVDHLQVVIAENLGLITPEEDKNKVLLGVLCLLAHDPRDIVRSTALNSIKNLRYPSEKELYDSIPKSLFVDLAVKRDGHKVVAFYVPELLDEYLRGQNELLNAYILAHIGKEIAPIRKKPGVSISKELLPGYELTRTLIKGKTIEELFEKMDSSEPIRKKIRELSKSKDKDDRRMAAAVLLCMPKDQLETKDKTTLFFLMCDPDLGVRYQAEYAGEKHGYTTVESLCKDLIGEIGEEELSKQIEEANYMGCRDVKRATVVADRVFQKVKGTLNNALKSTGVPGDAIGGKKEAGKKAARRIEATQ